MLCIKKNLDHFTEECPIYCIMGENEKCLFLGWIVTIFVGKILGQCVWWIECGGNDKTSQKYFAITGTHVTHISATHGNGSCV